MDRPLKCPRCGILGAAVYSEDVRLYCAGAGFNIEAVTPRFGAGGNRRVAGTSQIACVECDARVTIIDAIIAPPLAASKPSGRSYVSELGIRRPQ
jgi:hypothetical protein